MKRPLLLPLLLFLLIHTPLRAQWLKRPLQFFPADSVTVWSYGGDDLLRTALQRVPQAVQEKLQASLREGQTVGKGVENRREEIWKAWQTMAPHLNVAGGGDDELADGQSVPAAYALSAALPLWQMTGDARFADYAERVLFNALPRPLRQPQKEGDGQDVSLAALLLSKLPGYLYATSADGRELYLNLYTNATARLPLQGECLLLDQITEMPAKGGVKFRFSSLKRPLKLRVHLRLPDWAVARHSPGTPFRFIGTPPAAPEIYVNGHELAQSAPDERGYVTVEREWRNGDEIFLNFPLAPQYLRRADAASGMPRRGELALQRGPLVYVITTEAEGCYFSANSPAADADSLNAKGNVLIGGTMYDGAHAPQDAAAPPRTFRAEPYADGAAGIVWGKENR